MRGIHPSETMSVFLENGQCCLMEGLVVQMCFYLYDPRVEHTSGLRDLLFCFARAPGSSVRSQPQNGRLGGEARCKIDTNSFFIIHCIMCACMYNCIFTSYLSQIRDSNIKSLKRADLRTGEEL